MFNRGDEKIANENIIIKERPNIFLSCKKIFVLFIFLGAISYTAPIVINYINQMQVHLVRVINLPLTGLATAITFILIFLIIIWIIWTLISWAAKKYIISDHRITYKSGIIFQKTIHMPYAKVQDVVISQGILGKIASVGTVTAYSGYDNSKLELTNISNPNKVEEIIFEEINKLYSPYPNQDMSLNQSFAEGPNFNNISNFQDNYNSHDNQGNNPNNYANYNNPESYDNYEGFNNYNENMNNSQNYGNHENYNNEGNFGYDGGVYRNFDDNIKNRYYGSSENDEKPSRIHDSINDNDFPFLRKDKGHDVSNYVENPEEYRNSSTFLGEDSRNKEENDKYADNKDFISPDINNDNFRNFINEHGDRDDFTDENDYFDQTMNQAMNNLDNGLKFRNNNNNNNIFNNSNNENNNSNNQNIQNQYQQDYQNHQNFNNQYNQNYNHHNPNHQYNNQQNYQNNNNPQNYGQQNNIQQNHYNKQQYDDQNKQNDIQYKNAETKEDKSKAVLERHFRKFKK